MTKLSHFDQNGSAHMVDVSAKPVTQRRAVAEGTIHMQPATLALILAGGHQKGDVLGVARLAGIMAAKKTAELIPLCHPLSLSSVQIALTPVPDKPAISCEVTVVATGQTGVEMEALLAVEITLLTIYDMCKAADRGMVLSDIRLVAKSGGRSGDWHRQAKP